MSTSTISKLRNWTPLLGQNESGPLLASIHDIAQVLEAKLKKSEPPQLTPDAGEGAAAVAIFFAYLELAGLRPGAGSLAFDFINRAIESLATEAMGPSLYGGFSGVAWAAEHVTRLLSDSPEDLGGDIDAALETYLNRSPWKEDYDLIVGLVGIGVYCLERPHSPVARRCLELIVERLSELAEVSGDGVRWFTPPSLIPPQQKDLYPEGYYNLGLAHGIPGIIAFLGRAYAAGITQKKTGDMLEGAVRWFLRQRLPATAKSSFGTFVQIGKESSEDSRLAWCYGDGGIAAALLLAARCTGNKNWEAEAIQIARRSARRDPQTCYVRDVSFCHGTVGLAHIFNRFYHATHDELFAQASRYWLQQTLEHRQPGTGAAGYSVLLPDEKDNEKLTLQPRFGLIEGVAGLGLSFLAAVSHIEPLWDRMFMVDIPPLPLKP
jgi:lantibiotic modifying enzyme